MKHCEPPQGGSQTVIPKANGYVMFCQDSDVSVHSVGIEGGGAVTGDDVLQQRSYRYCSE